MQEVRVEVILPVHELLRSVNEVHAFVQIVERIGDLSTVLEGLVASSLLMGRLEVHDARIIPDSDALSLLAIFMLVMMMSV